MGLGLVERAATLSRDRGGDWLHVDHDEDLTPSHETCGVTTTPAGLIGPTG